VSGTNKAVQVLKDILGLKYEPIAVNFLETKAAPQGFEMPIERRYFQLLMGAGEGRKLLLTRATSPARQPPGALGFKEPPLKLTSGEMTASMGIFASPVVGRKTLSTMLRLPMGKYKAIACCHLTAAPFGPDVVVLEATAEQLMWPAENALEVGLYWR